MAWMNALHYKNKMQNASTAKRKVELNRRVITSLNRNKGILQYLYFICFTFP